MNSDGCFSSSSSSLLAPLPVSEQQSSERFGFSAQSHSSSPSEATATIPGFSCELHLFFGMSMYATESQKLYSVQEFLGCVVERKLRSFGGV